MIRGLRYEENRGVSELVGTVLIIGMVITAAVLLIAIGGMALQSITQESTDTVAEQSFQEMDSRINEITQSSADEATTFQFPEGTGQDLETNDNGRLNVTVEPVMNRSAIRGVSGTGGAKCGLSEDVKLGTIIHEEDDNKILAYQGGGLWRLSDSGVEVMSAPDLNYDGESVDFSFVNVSGAEHFDEEVTIEYEANETTNTNVRDELSDCWTADVDGTDDGVVPINMNVTIHSSFAQGWATYATGSRATSPSMRVAPNNWSPDVQDVDEEFEMQFTNIGHFGGLCSERDTFDHPNVTYAGPANGTKCTEEVYHPESHDGFIVDPASDEHKVGVYNSSTGEWVNLTVRNDYSRNGSDIFDKQVNEDVTNEFPHDEVDETADYDVYDLKPENENSTVHICILDNDTKDFTDANCLEEQLGVDDPSALVPENASDVRIDDIDIDDETIDADTNETLTVEATITNYGDTDDQYAVLWDEDVDVLRDFEDSSPKQRIEFTEGDTKSIEFEWEPEPADASTDDRNFRIATEDDYESFNVTIDSSTLNASNPTYVVSDVSASDKVQAGTDLAVTANIANTGDKSGSQYVTLKDFDGHTVDWTADEVELSSGENETVTLVWETDGSDVDTDTITVRTDDDSTETEVEVTDSDGVFEPVIEDAPSSVIQGQTVTVETTVYETDGIDGTQWIRLEDDDGNVVDTAKRYIPGGSSTSVTLEWDSSDATPGTNNVTVVTNDNTNRTQVSVAAGSGDEAFYNVTDVEADNTTVTEGENITVTATVDNEINASGNQSIILSDFNNNAVDLEEDVEITGEGQTDVTLTWNTRLGDAGTGGLTVSTEDSSGTVSVTVENSSTSNAGLVYVGLAKDSSYWDSTHTEPDTAYQAVGQDSHGVCASETDTKSYHDNPTDVVCKDVSTMESGYLLDDDEYTLYLGDMENNTWMSTDPLSESDSHSVMVHSDHTNELDDGGYTHGDIEAFYFADEDQPVCIAEEGASINPDEDCGDVVGGLEKGDGNWLEADASKGNLSYLTTQVGKALEQEEINETRPPADVMIALDESGSMGNMWDWYDKSTPNGVQTVPNNEIWVLQNTSGPWWQTEDIRYAVPGEKVDFGNYPDADTIQLKRFNGGNDPSGQRLKATRTLIGGLNQTAGDRVGALEFADYFRIHNGLTNDHDAVNDSLRLSPGGGTDITGALQEAENRVEPTSDNRKEYIILLTDGRHDEFRSAKLPDEYAQEDISNEITIYTVGFGNANETALREIAAGGSGEGEYYEGDDASQLNEIFADIGEDIDERDPIIQRNSTTLSAVNGGDQISVNDTNINNPDQFTDSEPIEDQLNLSAQDLHFEIEIAQCNDYERTGETVTDSDGTTYEQTECVDWDEDSTTTIDNSSVDDHLIITKDNDKDLGDIDSEKFWQPDPEDLNATDPYTVGDTVEPDLAGNDALIALNVSESATGGQSGYVLMHFEVDGERDDWEGNVGEDEPVFEITSLDSVSPDPASIGENVSVQATIENTGTADGEQAVILTDPDGHHADDTTLSLGRGESDTVTLDWVPKTSADNATIRLATANDYVETDVTVNEPTDGRSEILVDSVSADNVTVGETLTATAEVSLNGTEEQTQAVVLEDFNGKFVDATQVTLNSSIDSETVSLEWEPTESDTRTDNITVQTEDDSGMETVTVDSTSDVSGSNFRVSVNDSPSETVVEVNETVVVNVTVTNVGDVNDTQSVLLEDENENVVNATEVTLDDSESKDVTVEWETGPGDEGSDEFQVASEDDSENVTVTVNEAGGVYGLEVYALEPIDTVTAGETVEVTATINATATATENVMLDNPDGNIEDFESMSLAATSTPTDITLEWTPDGSNADVDDAEIRVYTESDRHGLTEDIEIVSTGGDDNSFGQSADDTSDPVEIDISDIQIGA